jgi:hypothetical protein
VSAIDTSARRGAVLSPHEKTGRARAGKHERSPNQVRTDEGAKMAESNLPQLSDPFFQLLFDNVFDRQIKFTDRLLAEALLRECLKEERCRESEN